MNSPLWIYYTRRLVALLPTQVAYVAGDVTSCGVHDGDAGCQHAASMLHTVICEV